MAEMDALERRVAETLLWYADEVAPAVDASAVAHRVALEHPRRRARALPWQVAVPRRAWVPLLLAGLLAAMVGGMLIAGSQREPKLPAVIGPLLSPTPAPTATTASDEGTDILATTKARPLPAQATCPPGSDPDKPGPVDQARPVDSGAVAFDRRAGKMVALVSTGSDVETWTFNVCANTWTQMHPTWKRMPGYLTTMLPQNEARLIYDVDSDVTLLITYTETWVYDLQADTWTFQSIAPGAARLWTYDPLSGLVVGAAWIRDHQGLVAYDVETDTWTPIHEVSPATDTLPGHGALAHDASVDRIVSYTGPETWLLNPRTGTWSRSSAETPRIPAGWDSLPTTAIFYDEAARRTVAVGGDRIAAYDVSADRWEILVEGYSDGRRAWTWDSVAYDPINRRLVGLVPPSEDGDGVVVDEVGVEAFDPVTREWTVLLEPGTGQATP